MLTDITSEIHSFIRLSIVIIFLALFFFYLHRKHKRNKRDLRDWFREEG